MPEDSTVYTITAGYVPTLGFRKSDFQMDRKAGKLRRTAGNEGKNKVYDGSLITYGDAIGKDGALRRTRLRGSVAWYEFSTSIRAVNEMIEKDSTGLMEAQMEEWADRWYNKGHNTRTAKKLQSDVNSELINFIPSAGKTVEASGEKTNPTPEEQKVAGDVMEKVERVAPVGQSHGIDVYMRNSDGKIYRLDVTAMTMDTKEYGGAHHGLTSFEDRKKRGVTGKQLIEADGQLKKGARKKLWNYFKDVQTNQWNPPIKSLKNIIRSGQDGSAKLLKELESKKGKTLADLKAKDADFLNELRQKGRKGAAGAIKERYKGKDREYHQILSKAFRSRAQKKAFASGLEFALHMLGNVLDIFAKDSARQGGYSTGYTLGEGQAANFVVEVMHKIHSSGSNVFEFRDLKLRDVHVHTAAALTDVYRQKIWDEDKATNHHTHEGIHRSQNEQHTVQLLTNSAGSVEIGTQILSGGHELAKGDIVHRGAAMIAPKEMNKDIDNFISGLASKAGRKQLKNFLRKRLLNKTTAAKGMADVGNFGKSKLFGIGNSALSNDDTYQRSLDYSGMTAQSLKPSTPFSINAKNFALTQVNPFRGQKKGKFWSLDDYLNRNQKTDFSEKINPSFWAAPYIGVLYPSIQVGQKGNK